jgi:hypothetical protein
MRKLIGVAIFILGVTLLSQAGVRADTSPALSCDSPKIRAVISRHLQEPTVQVGKPSKDFLACESRDGSLLWAFHLLPDGSFTFTAKRQFYYYKAEGIVGPERAIAGDMSMEKKTCRDPDVRDDLAQLSDSEPYTDLGAIAFNNSMFSSVSRPGNTHSGSSGTKRTAH